mgnify:FL=1
MGQLFVYDRLLPEPEICNFKKEIALIWKQVSHGECIKIYGMRNFGKTSIIKNVIAPRWEKSHSQKRVVFYADLYSVETSDDLSSELTRAFNEALSTKKNLLSKATDWLGALKKIRPTWQPTSDGLGEFSFRTDKNEAVVDYTVVLQNIKALSESGQFEFLVIFDEFQEIGKIPKAQARLRGVLQEMPNQTPIVILGSKHHLLRKIFEDPRAPFHSWGSTIELNYIPYEEYRFYLNERLQKVGKSIDEEPSRHLQDKLGRIPEAINRIADFIGSDEATQKEITPQLIDQKLSEYLELSQSNYSVLFSNFSQNERIILQTIARNNGVEKILNKKFLAEVMISKSGVENLIKRLLDESALYRIMDDSQTYRYVIADPIFGLYLRKYKNLK